MTTNILSSLFFSCFETCLRGKAITQPYVRRPHGMCVRIYVCVGYSKSTLDKYSQRPHRKIWHSGYDNNDNISNGTTQNISVYMYIKLILRIMSLPLRYIDNTQTYITDAILAIERNKDCATEIKGKQTMPLGVLARPGPQSKECFFVNGQGCFFFGQRKNFSIKKNHK